MLPTTLTTNEVKSSGGTSVPFYRDRSADRTVVYAASAAAPNQPHTITISHNVIGTGVNQRRRSVVRVDQIIDCDGDETTELALCSAYTVIDIPIGKCNQFATAGEVLSNLISFLASKGASTTILYDNSGYGAEALLKGTL